VEYGLITSLVLQQYRSGEEVLFDRLLALPLDGRIPAMMEQHGAKTVHRLLLMLIQEFVASLELPAYKRPSETRMRVAVCELMLIAQEDYLGVEDLIVFLERARTGAYGPIKTLVNMNALLHLLEQYRQERHTVYIRLKQEQEDAWKQLGPSERSAPRPTPVGDLFSQALVLDLNRKMSG